MMSTKPFFSESLVCAVLVFTLVITGSEKTNAQDISVIPIPASVEPDKGSFTLTASTSILIASDDPRIKKVADYLAGAIESSTGFNLGISKKSGASNIEFAISPTTDALLAEEGYRIIVNDQKVKLSANTPAGLFYGVQTILQLLPKEIESKTVVSQMKWRIPAVNIVDYPRFPYRGIMLDVSRHFFSKQYVKEYIEQLARYKFNRLHLHLTDDNGWRIEIK